jgi:hypothetical protein
MVTFVHSGSSSSGDFYLFPAMTSGARIVTNPNTGLMNMFSALEFILDLAKGTRRARSKGKVSAAEERRKVRITKLETGKGMETRT